jgi:hypothetical protein
LERGLDDEFGVDAAALVGGPAASTVRARSAWVRVLAVDRLPTGKASAV